MEEAVEWYLKNKTENKEEKAVRPLLKWVGGKSLLLPFIIPSFLDNFNNGEVTYIEPFAGSGCLALALNYPKMILNDKNIKLMNFHEQTQQKPEKLYRKIIKYIEVYNKIESMEEKEKFYYETRKKYNDLTLAVKNNGLTHASLFWFLNKTCFNGMYREKRNGDFNIPFGKRACPVPKIEDFIAVSSILNKCSLYHKQFSDICDMAKCGDIVYLDPPYIPISKTANFSGYLRYGFGLLEHQNLCKEMEKMSNRGVYVLMSNSNCKSTFEVYGSLKDFVFHTVETKRFVSGKAKGRGIVGELLISNGCKYGKK